MHSSPTFRFEHCDYGLIRDALDTVGHAVLERVWNLDYLRRLQGLIARKFDADDARYAGKFDQFPKSSIDAYLGGSTDIPSLFDTHEEQVAADEEFFREVDRTGLPALYRFLLGGDFMIGSSERVVRRFNPGFQMGFVQLHTDYQFGVCSRHGLRSRDSFTLWSPLQDCVDDDISRLLLLHRGESDADLATREERIEAQEAEYLMRDPAKVDSYMQRVYDHRRCYAPSVPLGNGILFRHDVVHGTYMPKGTSRYRFSLDFRVVGEYTPAKENAHISGQIYRRGPYPPPPPPRFDFANKAIDFITGR